LDVEILPGVWVEGKAAMREDMVGRGAVREGGPFESGPLL
jgi:hypothetical protein